MKLNPFKSISFGNVSSAYDQLLVIIVACLFCIGFIMVASSSITESIDLTGDPFHFISRHAIYVVLSIFMIGVVVSIPSEQWYNHQNLILFLSFLMLFLVLIVGTEINGSHRWIGFGPLTLQPSEFAKLSVVLFIASYLQRRQIEVIDTLRGFIKPMAVLFLFVLLLMLQPDLGSTVVIIVIMMGILFISGARMISFVFLTITLLASVVILIITSPYRMARVVGFLDPWADPFGKSYQLTQSLMAFGRGGLFGQGLGNSVLKLEYLPEAHTDFIMAILAEEMGFIGVVIVISLEFFLVYKAFNIGKKALSNSLIFQGYVSIGIAIWFAFQTAVNIGAASGIAPTKGLTLPLLSYGGSSLLSISIAIGLLLRIDFETRKILSPVRFIKGKAEKGDKNDSSVDNLVNEKFNEL
ncbi:MAG: putative lipid II flippase FtsW [Psychromonas sp.]|nr:putative lipid II flippase FtsW [Psychromonas sp.]